METIQHFAFWFFFIDLALVSLAVLHMLYQRRTPQSLATWLLAIILLPYIGVLIYFFFGLRKSYSKRFKPIITQQNLPNIKDGHGLPQKIHNLMVSNQLAGSTENNKVEVISSDTEAFSIMLKLIEDAQQQIMLETYIFETDDTGQQLLQALTKKAQKGVRVYLLMDAIGSFKAQHQKQAFSELRNAGGEVHFFQPIWPNIITSQINLRNHRKIYLFDQHTLLTGGLNLSNDYLGKDDTKKRWEDLLFKIQGPACFHFENIFNQDWLFATQQKLTLSKPINDALAERNTNNARASKNIKVDEIIQSIPSGPDIASDTLYETLLHAIYDAKQEIKIATPYFIPDNNIMRALMIAVKRGVKVKVLTPIKSDHWLFDFGRSSYMRELYEAGGEMLYFSENMLHAKLIIFDNKAAMSGSANFDYRSLFLNYEMVHFLYCENSIKQLSQWFADKSCQATKYQPTNTKTARLVENISRIIAPIL